MCHSGHPPPHTLFRLSKCTGRSPLSSSSSSSHTSLPPSMPCKQLSLLAPSPCSCLDFPPVLQPPPTLQEAQPSLAQPGRLRGSDPSILWQHRKGQAALCPAQAQLSKRPHRTAPPLCPLTTASVQTSLLPHSPVQKSPSEPLHFALSAQCQEGGGPPDLTRQAIPEEITCLPSAQAASWSCTWAGWHLQEALPR